MRRAAKVDGNHREIVDALRTAGCAVLDLSRVGGGCPDLLVSKHYVTVLAEVKQPKGKLRASQEQFVEDWGTHAYIHVLRSVDDAMELVKWLWRFA